MYVGQNISNHEHVFSYWKLLAGLFEQVHSHEQRPHIKKHPFLLMEQKFSHKLSILK